MVTICQQCGDEGFSNAFVYCIKCLEFAVHRYCLDKIPKTFDEFVDWVCKDCEPEVPNQSTPQKPSSISSQKRNHTSPEHVEAIRCRTKLQKKRDTTCLAAEAEEQRCHDGPSQEFSEAHIKRKHEHVQLTGDCSPLIKTPKRRKDITSSVAEENDTRHQSSPSEQQLCETHKELDLTNHVQLARNFSQLKMNLKEKKHDVTGSVAQKGEQRLDTSPSQQHDKAHTKMDLTGHPQLASNSSPMKINSNKKKYNTCSVANRQEQGHASHSSQQALDACSKLELTKHAKLVRTCSTIKVKSNKKIKDISCSVEKTEEQSCRSLSSQQHCMEHTTVDLTKDVVLVEDCSSMNGERRSIQHGKDSDLKKESRLMLDTGSNFDDEVSQLAAGSNHIQHDYHRRTEPVESPVWRGDFSILNKNHDKFDGFVAHVSSKACPKVFEEASLLPSLLDLEMLPKADVWPKSFQISEPSDESIALYLFPAELRYERVFDHLVGDMIDRELAMKGKVKNAELLVFTSTELPMLYWRFQGKYYLWGVFRGKQASQSHSMYPDSANDMATAVERNTKTFDAGSPVSPMNNCHSYMSGS